MFSFNFSFSFQSNDCIRFGKYMILLFCKQIFSMRCDSIALRLTVIEFEVQFAMRMVHPNQLYVCTLCTVYSSWRPKNRKCSRRTNWQIMFCGECSFSWEFILNSMEMWSKDEEDEAKKNYVREGKRNHNKLNQNISDYFLQYFSSLFFLFMVNKSIYTHRWALVSFSRSVVMDACLS